jgi:hypothetical protein
MIVLELTPKAKATNQNKEDCIKIKYSHAAMGSTK